MQPVFNYAGVYDAQGTFQPADLSSLPGLLWLVSGQGFQSLMFAYPPGALLDQVLAFSIQLVRAFFAVGIGPGLLGLAVLARRRPRSAGLLAAWFACAAFFFSAYAVQDKATMYLPCYLVWALLAAAGYQALFDWIRTERLVERFSAVRVMQAIVVLSVLAALLWTWPLVDQSQAWEVRAQAEQRLASLPRGAVLLGYWDTIPAIEYLQMVEGRRSDVRAINRFLVPNETYPDLLENLSARGLVYLAAKPDHLPANLRVQQAGDFYLIVPRTPIAHRINQPQMEE